MLRMVIVDDEAIILQGLKEIINWGELGFDTVGCFADGAPLLEALKSGLVIDVILTDIRMDHISGIDIARYVKEEALPTRVVLLSGYRDFDYARSAIAYGVTDYLTKPCSLSQIREVFTRLASSIQAEKSLRDAWTARLSDAQSMADALREWVFESLLLHRLPAALQTQRMLHGFMQYAAPRTCVGRIFKLQFAQSQVLSEEMSCALRRCIASFFATHNPPPVATLVPASEPPCLVLQAGETDHLPTQEDFDQLSDYAARVLGLPLRFEVWCSFEDLGTLLQEGVPGELPQPAPTGPLGQVQPTMAFDIQYAQARNLGMAQLRTFLICALLATEEGEERQPSPQLAVQRILQCQTLPQLDQTWKELCGPGESPGTQAQGPHTNAVQAACKYIRLHCEEPLSLTGVARKTYMHPSYLSRIFKQQTGKTFKAFLTECRVERANVLLRDPTLKVYDIAKQVGYQDIRHFYEVYKRLTGRTPSGYRAEVLMLGLCDDEGSEPDA